MVTSINNPQTMGLGFRDMNSVPRYNTPTGQTTPTQNAAANLGYERGTSSILSGVASVIPGGNFIKGPLGIGANDTFGNEGTADAQGNVFDSTGRAWDPITGRAVASYDNLSAGTNTLKNSYGKLREHGEGPISSALGSYDNSIYKQMDDQRNADGSTITAGEARTARLRGEGSPINSVAGRIGTNTDSMEDNFNETGDATMGNKPVSAYDIGFDGSRSTTVNSTTGNFGSGAGDIVGLSGNQLGVLSPQYRDNEGKLQSTGSNDGDTVNIQSPTGTVVSITDSVTGESINATKMSPLLKQELDRRAGNDNNEHHRIIEPDPIKSVPSRIKARNMNEFGDVISGDGNKNGKLMNTAEYGNSLLETRGADNDGDNSTDSNSGGK